MDFTDVLAALAVTATVSAIGAAAALKILPGFARWSYNKLIGWFR